MERPDVLFLTGPPGAGKTTVAHALAAAAPKGVHLPVDEVRSWVVGGLASPEDWTDETDRQFALAERATADVAARYARAGFFVVVDHVARSERWAAHLDPALAGLRVARVCLLPGLETVVARNAGRTNKPFDVSLVEPLVRSVHPWMAEGDWAGWTVLDTSGQSLAETLAAVEVAFGRRSQ